MNIKQAIKYGAKKLEHFSSPKLESEVLLMDVLEKDRIFLKTNSDYELSEIEQSLYKNFINKREKSIPVAYILRYKRWGRMDIIVNEDVLIPRDETEILCSIICDSVNKEQLSILDIGTGSGCISLYLAKKIKGLDITCIDISEKALVVAQQNFDKQGLVGHFIKSDLLETIVEDTYFDLIIANLPYVPQNLEVTKDLSYEPSNAIFSGDDGLGHIKRLESEIRSKKIKFGALWLEFLPLQKNSIKEIFSEYKIRFYTDDGGNVFFTKIMPLV